MTDVLAGLNPAQREAVEQVAGPVLILAGPGSGKTRVIVHRVAYLIKVCGISPRRIMAVTFTNKAAREMLDRLGKMVSGYVRDLTVGTFHAICVRILRQEGRKASISPNFVIYDADDQLSLIKQALQEEDYAADQYSAPAILSAISNAKSRLIGAEQFIQQGKNYFEEVVGKVYKRYQSLLQQSNALDFDDLLLKTVWLFQQNPDVLTRYQERYQHIVVDEFQDTNLVQYELIKQLAGKHRNVCVVGDPDQSIYSWRSADLRNILNFEKDFPETKTFFLGQSYRSTKMILETASHIISANKQRKPLDLWTENEKGDKVCLIECVSQQEEAQFVVREIERLTGNDGAKLGDCAVMYRTNAQSRVLEEAFIRYGMPYKLVAGRRFYERREVKDIIAYLRLLQNPCDSVSLMRVLNVPQRGIGQKSTDGLNKLMKVEEASLLEAIKIVAEGQNGKNFLTQRAIKSLTEFYELLTALIESSRKLELVELFDQLIKKTGYQEYLLKIQNGEERWDNVLELRTVAQEFDQMAPGEGLAALLENVALVSDVDGLDESLDSVTLITLHQAKGLEFPAVFVVGVEEGILPHFRSFDDPAQMEEERRLCYVGVTRAKERLYLVRAFRRALMGGTTTNEPSRFLDDIPRHLMESSGFWPAEENQLKERLYCWDDEPQGPPVSLMEIKSGDRVRHRQFGDGVVTGYQQLSDDAEVLVDFRLAGTKKLLLSFAHLEKLD